jgi:hypothetical protein
METKKKQPDDQEKKPLDRVWSSSQPKHAL